MEIKRKSPLNKIEIYISLYIINLKYSHLTPIFDYTISIEYSLPAHTNSNGYCATRKLSFQDF